MGLFCAAATRASKRRPTAGRAAGDWGLGLQPGGAGAGGYCRAVNIRVEQLRSQKPWAANVKLCEFMTLSSRFSGYFCHKRSQ